MFLQPKNIQLYKEKIVHVQLVPASTCILQNLIDSTMDLSITSPVQTTIDIQDHGEDDISIATETTDNRPPRGTRENREYVVKITFKPKTASAAGEVAKSHFTLLRAMHDNFTDSVSIFDNQGKPLKDLKTPKTVDAYLRHFQMHFVKENKEKKRGPMYYAIHRVYSKVSIGENP